MRTVLRRHVRALRPTGRGTAHRAPTTERLGKPVSGSLPTVVRAFKSAATKHVNIIRNETELQRIRKYIHKNPARWQEDALHPDQPPFPRETRESSPPYGHEVWMV
ncbi:MAG: hypothetical protein D3923_04900 [Candidatus Electrothrix sp. AR3]|nr:hypothetical protein [Candidatus Electrothrix sp. AR3]